MQIAGTFWTELARVADFTTIVAIGVAVLAVILALRQLGQTEKAEEAADRARRDFRREAALRQLMMILPNLKKVEREIDTAVREDERPAVEQWLAEWCQDASEVNGMLGGQPNVPPALSNDLATSITHASTAKARLGDQDADVASTTERARVAIQMAGAGLAELAGRFRNFVETEEGTEEEESE